MSTQLLAAIILDPGAEYRPLPGYRVVVTDAEVVRAYPFREERIWAQGNRAADVCGRLAEEEGVECAVLRPAMDWVRDLEVPDVLTRSDPEGIAAAFWDAAPVNQLDAAQCVDRWLHAKLPGLSGLLNSADELARYLADDVTDDRRRPALLWLCRRKSASPRHRLVARILDSADPIVTWLGLNQDGDLGWIDESAGFLPQRLPQVLEDRVARHWRSVLVSAEGFGRAARLVSRDVGALRKVVRREAEAVYKGKPPRDRVGLEDACRILFGDDWVIRQAARQAGWPTLDPSADLPEMLDWFRAYREKADWRTDLDDERVAAARSFQHWFLNRDRFPRWCAQGERGPLCFSVNAVIRDEVRSASAVLLLLADGLGYREHGELMQLVTDRAPSLRVTRDQVVLATLPTVTAVCKGSLLSGRPQREWQVANYREMVGACRRRGTRSYYYDRFPVSEIIDRLGDSQTSLIAVNYTDLDRALHDASDASAIRGIVAGKLNELAINMAEVAGAVASDLEHFAIIIASDHGQVVGPCRPRPPVGEVVKQRLRPATGQPLPNEIRLPREETLCTEEYYAIADAHAWDGGSRALYGCHGGLFPEEVITRLTAYGFRPPVITVEVEAWGNGIAGVNGTLGWRMKNLSAVAITVRRVSLAWGDRSVPLRTPLAPLVGAFMERVFPDQKTEGWPGLEDVSSAWLEVEYVSHAGGEGLAERGPARIDSEQGYEVSPFEL